MMKLNKIFFITLLISSSSLAKICFKPIKKNIKIKNQLSVDEAIDLAFTNRPSQQAFDYSVKAGKEHEWSTLSGYFPHIDIQSRVGTTKRSLLLPKKQVFIEGKQLLLSFDGPIDRFRIARQETDVIYSQKLLDLDNIRFEVEKSILDLWDTRKKYDFINSLGISSEKIFNQDKHKNKLGLLDKNIWLTSVAQYAFATSQVAQYDDELSSVFANIERSLGTNISYNFDVNQSAMEQFITQNILAAYEHDSDYFYEYALNNRKELLEIDHQILREKYLSNSYAKSYLPEIYLFGQVQYYEFKPLKRASALAARASAADSKWIDWRVGLEFNWKFDSFENAFNSESAHATMLAYQATRLDATEQIKQEVQTTYDALQRSLKNLQAQEAQFSQSDNELILRKKQYEIGEISVVEMDQAETSWKQARYELITAKKQSATIYRELLAKSGYPENIS